MLMNTQTKQKMHKNGWYDALAPFWESPEWEQIKQKLKDECDGGIPVYPQKKNIFRALELTPVDNVKCVIIGQDPYHTPGMANGLAFGVNSTALKQPPSLQNIVKKVCRDHDLDHYPKSGVTLEGWAKQGVLLINSCLTVKQGQPGSHINKIGWEKLVLEILRVTSRKHNTSYLILGNKTWDMIEKQADYSLKKTLKFNKLITEVHPSPLSAYKGFFQSDCFQQVNDYCCKKGRGEINWLMFNNLNKYYGQEEENIECFLEPWTEKDDFYEQYRFGTNGSK